MSVSNILLVYVLLFKKQNSIDISEESNSKRKSLSFSVLFFTTMFIVLTLPVSILNAFFLKPLLEINYGYVVLFMMDNMAFTYHGLHFTILLVTNKRFAKELKTFFKVCVTSNKVLNNDDTNTVTNTRRLFSKKVAGTNKLTSES
jgi:hypothetical protein